MGQFLITSFLLGIGLAMDACAVSMANGFAEPKMKIQKIFLIALMFGLFQGIMPLIGYFIGSAFISYIDNFIPWIALVLLGFLGGKMLFEALRHKKENDSESINESENKEAYASSVVCVNENNIDGKYETKNETSKDNLPLETQNNLADLNEKTANSKKNNLNSAQKLTFKALFVQAIATSIDALSVGLTIADYSAFRAIICACIVALTTFGISLGSVYIGKKFGTKLGRKAEILGGIVLIIIGIEIFITGII